MLRRSAARDLRLVPAAVVAWLVSGVLVGMPDAGLPVAIVAWIAAIGALATAIAARSRRGWRDGLAAIAVAVTAGALVATAVVLRADIRAPPSLAEERGAVDVVLVATEEAAAGAERLRGTASMIGSTHGEMPVLVVGVRMEEDVGIGTTVRLRATISIVEPGGGLVAIAIGDGRDVGVVAPAPDWLAWGNAMRAGFRDLARPLPGVGGALLTGLAIGDDRELPQTLRDAMRTSSLTHLTAVSGANCAIVVGAVMVGGALLGIRRRWRIAASLLVLAAFVVLVTPQPSVVRAAVMAAFALGGLAIARPMRGLPLLSLAVAGILVVDPWASREFGFVLSVLATAGLLVLGAPLARLLAWVMPYRLAMALALPAAAQLACQPAIALLDASVPTYGVVANLLAVPAAPLATVAGLLACLFVPLAAPLAGALAWVAWLPSSWIGGVATTFAGLPAARLPWPEGLVGVALYALVSVATAFVALGTGRWRRTGGVVAGVIVASYAGVLVSWQVVGALDRPVHWQVAMCDVGQGDAAVVRSAGAIAVIDTGPEPDRMSACLGALGIGRIDLLVLSHFDHDHVGGAGALIGRVDRVLIGPMDAAAEARVVAPLAAGGAVIEEVRRGDAGILGSLAWQVLWPPARPGLEPGNDASVVVRLSPAAGADDCPPDGCLTMAFLGDLGADAQLRMLATGPVGHVDVVKVSHHGSADQAERLYRALTAPVALIGVGAENDYGHPTEQLLGILARLGTETGRTDTEGLLLVERSAEGGIVLWRERGG